MTTSKDDERSPALSLLAAVWRGCGQTAPASWERLNHATRRALELAIGAGLRFDEGDFRRLAGEFRFSRWAGGEGGMGEWAYRLAIGAGNKSACKAFEAWKRRPPFLADDVTLPGNLYVHRTYLHRQRGRLAIGAHFPWGDCLVSVTGFADDGESLTACAYASRYDGGGGVGKPQRRFRITRADLKAAHKAAREVAQASRLCHQKGPAARRPQPTETPT